MKLPVPESSRRGVAAVEMALVAPVLLLLLLGLWEVGRCVMVQNLLRNAAREGGRLGAAGTYLSSNNRTNPAGGTLTLSSPSTNSDCELEQKVLAYLQASGVSTTGAAVTVANKGSSSSSKSWSYTYTQGGSISGSGSDPAGAADQLDQLSITVTLPYSNVGWSLSSWFIDQQATLSATVSWSSMRDVPLSVTTTIPSQPLQSSDPLP